jgi:hypothetical protein
MKLRELLLIEEHIAARGARRLPPAFVAPVRAAMPAREEAVRIAELRVGSAPYTKARRNKFWGGRG